MARHQNTRRPPRDAAAPDDNAARTPSWPRALVLAALVGSALSLAAPAGACPLTNPECAVDTVRDTVADTVDDVDETADRAVEEVNDTVDDARETVEEVEKTVEETVNPDPGTTSEPPPPPTEPRDPGPEDPPGDDDPKDDPRDGGRDRVLGSRERDDQAAPPARVRFDPPSNLPPSDLRAVASEDPAGEPRESLGESAIEAAKDFAFPLIMSVLVGIFLVVQHRVDRRDPKFVFAPVDQEFLSFE